MISPYEKILKRNEDRDGREPREGKRKPAAAKPHLHMISFDDSEDSSRVDIPNIFLDEREHHFDPYSAPPSPPKPQKKAKPPAPPKPVIHKTDS